MVYEFKLREGLRFHNGDPCTAEDAVQLRALLGMGVKPLHARVHTVEVVDDFRVRFRLHAPWPDFLTFYGTTATGAGFVLPKRYLERVGQDGFKHHPIGSAGARTSLCGIPQGWRWYWKPMKGTGVRCPR